MISEKLQKKFDSGLRGDNLIAYEGLCYVCGAVNQVFFAFARDPEVLESMLIDQYQYKFDDIEEVFGIIPFSEKLGNCQACVPLRRLHSTVCYKRLPLVYANYLLCRKIQAPLDINFEKAQEQLSYDQKMDKALKENDDKIQEAIIASMKGKKSFAISS